MCIIQKPYLIFLGSSGNSADKFCSYKKKSGHGKICKSKFNNKLLPDEFF